MNLKHIDLLDILRSKKLPHPGKTGKPVKHKSTDNSAKTDSSIEKDLRLRLKKSGELNSSLENLVEQRTSKLLEIVSTNGKFLSVIAHDLRSPFSSIIGVLELLKLSLKDFDKKEIEEYVNIVYNSANNTLVLLDSLLEWAVSQNIEKTFKPVKLNLCSLLQQEIAGLKISAGQKQITMENTIEPGLNVTADLQMVKTIFRNLINNAIKYTKNFGKISITAFENTKFVEITVNDNGVGISPEDRKKLFNVEAFHSNPGTNDEKGTGLGLLLCKEFVELHGGNISIKSDSGKGSSFAFTLPHYL